MGEETAAGDGTGSEATESADGAATGSDAGAADDDGGASTDATATGNGDVDATVERFLRLEAELDERVPDPPAAETRGLVRAAERVPADGVPADYPLGVSTPEALRLDLEVDGQTVPVYLEWPEEYAVTAQLARLLRSLDLDPGSFANLYGEPVPVERADGRYVVALPPVWTATKRDGPPWILGLAVAWTVVTAGAFGGLVRPDSVAETVLVLLWLSTWLTLPLGVYLDVRHVRDYEDWNPSVAWVAGTLVPFLNVPVALAYLYSRRQAVE